MTGLLLRDRMLKRPDCGPLEQAPPRGWEAGASAASVSQESHT